MFGTITQLVITQIFQLFVGPTPVTWCSFYFLSFFLQPLVPKLTEPSEKKKKKTQKLKPNERRRRRKKRPKNPNPVKEDEEKKKKKLNEEDQDAV